MNEQSGGDENEKVYGLERLWITDERIIESITNDGDVIGHYAKCVKSLVFKERLNHDWVTWNGTYNDILREERFRRIEHVAGITFHRLDYLPNVKYITGHCQINDLVLLKKR